MRQQEQSVAAPIDERQQILVRRMAALVCRQALGQAVRWSFELNYSRKTLAHVTASLVLNHGAKQNVYTYANFIQSEVSSKYSVTK